MVNATAMPLQGRFTLWIGQSFGVHSHLDSRFRGNDGVGEPPRVSRGGST